MITGKCRYVLEPREADFLSRGILDEGSPLKVSHRSENKQDDYQHIDAIL
jgi:hypothetical protein